MKSYIIAICGTIMIASTWGCGSNVSFRQASDGGVPGGQGSVDPPPCVKTNTCPPSVDAADVFFQSSKNNSVDILIISDNSGSMVPEQEKMASKFTSFISG